MRMIPSVDVTTHTGLQVLPGHKTPALLLWLQGRPPEVCTGRETGATGYSIISGTINVQILLQGISSVRIETWMYIRPWKRARDRRNRQVRRSGASKGYRLRGVQPLGHTHLAHLEQMLRVSLAWGWGLWEPRPWLALVRLGVRLVTPSIRRSSRSSAGQRQEQAAGGVEVMELSLRPKGDRFMSQERFSCEKEGEFLSSVLTHQFHGFIFIINV